MPAISPEAIRTLKNFGCNTSGLTHYDEKRNYAEGKVTPGDAATFSFAVITPTNYFDRLAYDGLDPEKRNEANWNNIGEQEKQAAFSFNGHRKFKFIFAMPFKPGNNPISKSLELLGWLPNNDGGKTYMHIFTAPANTDYASNGGTIRAANEIMFPSKIPNEWFTRAYRVERKGRRYVPSDITALF